VDERLAGSTEVPVRNPGIVPTGRSVLLVVQAVLAGHLIFIADPSRDFIWALPSFLLPNVAGELAADTSAFPVLGMPLAIGSQRGPNQADSHRTYGNTY
jgi:hypothetical protein